MSQRQAFRPDIEGLRAIAILLVLAYHAQWDLFSGGFLGVDIFFVLSGYLITRSLLHEAQQSQGVRLRDFYARRVRRLLPAAVLVLSATAVGVRALLPPTMWQDFGGDITAAAAYVVNWRLASRSVDYLAEDVAASPVLHFWSLSVEEQFYVVWPVLILACVWLALRRGWRLHRTLAVALVVGVIVPSLVASASLTASEPARAFFHTGTRMWELAIGALCAVTVPFAARVPPVARTWVKGGAVSAIVVMAMTVEPSSPWPGLLALGAVLPTAVLLLLGEDSTPDAVHRALSVRPMQYVGAWSYSLYLWHWPPLAILAARWGQLTLGQAVLIVALSTIPAVASYYLVENPVRYAARLKASPGLALSVGANLSLVAVVVGLTVGMGLPSNPTTGASEAVDPFSDESSEVPTEAGAPAVDGARMLDLVLTDDELVATLDDTSSIVPAPTAATADIPRTYPDGCHVRLGDAEPVLCDYGDEDAQVHLALVGDSKAGQWATALIEIAERNDWRLTNITKSACELSTTMPDREGEPDPECLEWGRRVIDRLAQEPPDLVLVSQGSGEAFSDDPDVSPEDLMVRGMVDAYEQIEAAGSEVVILMDNFSPGRSVYECVAEHAEDLRACTFERPAEYQSRSVQAEAARVGDVPVIDMMDQICPTQTCLPVIGDVLVYRQGSHLTATYILTTAPQLERYLVPHLRTALTGQQGSS